MTLLFHLETTEHFDFSCEEVARQVISAALDYEHFPYEAEVSLTLVDNEAIREINREFRQIDTPTDVLSFPMIDYPAPEILGSGGDGGCVPSPKRGGASGRYRDLCSQGRGAGAGFRPFQKAGIRFSDRPQHAASDGIRSYDGDGSGGHGTPAEGDSGGNPYSPDISGTSERNIPAGRIRGYRGAKGSYKEEL